MCLEAHEWDQWASIPLEKRFWIDEIMNDGFVAMVTAIPEYQSGNIGNHGTRYVAYFRRNEGVAGQDPTLFFEEIRRICTRRASQTTR